MRKLALILAMSATAAEAQDFSEDQKAAFIAAIAANGCTMTEAEAEVQLPAVGIDREVSGEITVYLMDRNQATLSEDMLSITLAPELCP